MPQLDMLILSSQSIFLLFFILGYIFFMKKILPIMAFELKMKELIEISYLAWLDKLVLQIIPNDKSFIITIRLLNAIYHLIIQLSTNKYIIYGYSYGFDLISLRKGYRIKYENRLY
jgi:Plant ATP synthase F0.